MSKTYFDMIQSNGSRLFGMYDYRPQEPDPCPKCGKKYYCSCIQDKIDIKPTYNMYRNPFCK